MSDQETKTKENRFVHLHLHSEYSLLDGAIRLRDLPRRLKELGMTSCALTDHGVMYGLVDFYQMMVKEGLKPILGCEVYVAPEGMLIKDGPEARRMNHLVLLCENQAGLKNLNHILTAANIQGFYYKPRVDHALLKKHSEGIIALSACLSGEIPEAILAGNLSKAKETIKLYQDIFGKDNFFLEVQENGIPDQQKVNIALKKLSAEMDAPLVATNDCHYLMQEDWLTHDILLCMQTGRKVNDQDRMRMDSDQFYLKSPEEMIEAFEGYPGAIENTVKIAERCNAKFDFDALYLPEFPVPDEFPDAKTYLRHLCDEGLEERFKDLKIPEEEQQAYWDRLDSELDVIMGMGYTDYYLIVWDFIKFARTEGIMVGPGRGSGAASLAAWALRITNVDPLKYHLLFERFLNPDRVSLPDFDIDFCYERRQEVIDYVTRKYGEEHVCQVITFGTLAARSAVRDVGRALDMPISETDRLAKMIPEVLGITLDKALEISPELKEAYDNNPMAKRVLDVARQVEGMPRHASTHAAGVIISSVELADVAPLARNDDSIVVQYSKDHIEEIGLLKFDFLGLRNLTVLRDSRDLIYEKEQRVIDYDTMTMDDPKVFEMISRGDTMGVFQLESPGMTNFMMRLEPKNLEDIIAGISLFRPGPMEQIDSYLEARKDPSTIHYATPLLEPILNVTQGTIIYQEQVMQIVRSLGGFSLGQADLVRRAMAKKKPEELARYEELFIHGGEDAAGNPVDGCIKRGVPEQVGRDIFQQVMAFAGYAFNKAHAAAYAVLAYQTAWLKYYYPVEFMAALLNTFMGNLDKANAYISAAKDLGIDILGPDINRSDVRFTTEDGAIRFALAAVKNVGEAQVEKLVKEREENGKFKSFGDFLRRAQAVGISKKCIESLILASALDQFPEHRAQMIASTEPYLKILQTQTNQMEGQLSLFDLGNAPAEVPVREPELVDVPRYSHRQDLAAEKEMLGIYISGHPLDDYRQIFESSRITSSREFLSEGEESIDGDADEDLQQDFKRYRSPRVYNGSEVVMGGLLNHKVYRQTRNQKLMCILELEDLEGSYEAVVYENILQEINEQIVENKVYLLRGRIYARDEFAPSLTVDEMLELQASDDLNTTKVSQMLRGMASLEELEHASNTQAWNPYPKPPQAGYAYGPSRNARTEVGTMGKAANREETLYLHLPVDISEKIVKRLKATLEFFQGSTAVRIYSSGEGDFLKDMPQSVEASPFVLERLRRLLGKENLYLAKKHI